MSDAPRVCVLGGGNGAFATASALAVKGFKVNLCEVPEWQGNIEPVMAKGGIDLEVVIRIPSMQSGFAKLERVGVDPEEALSGADLVFVVVPAFAQRRFAEFAAPFLRSGQVVALTPGNLGGSMEWAAVLKEKGVKERPILVDVESMIYSGFKNGPTSVQVSGFKRNINCAAFPATKTARALQVIHRVYPNLGPGENVLTIGLSKAGTVMHPTITLLNAGWIEKTQGNFLFYWDGLTSAVGNVMERLESERLALGKALGLNLISTRDSLLGYYADQGAKGDTLAEVASTNPVYGIDRAPKNMRHRFLLEDIPYGLVPIEELAGLGGVATPMCSALVEIASAMLQTDFRREGRGLKRLGLAGLTLAEIKRLVNEVGY
jgi:opine dehydrogenase